MSDIATLEQVEHVVVQLPPYEQLTLVARISERLSIAVSAAFAVEGDEEQARNMREARADALLQELDMIAESIEGEFDAAEDIRQIRQERANRL